MDLNSELNSLVWEIFFALLSTFSNFEDKDNQNGSKREQKILHFFIQFRLRILHFVKKDLNHHTLLSTGWPSFCIWHLFFVIIIEFNQRS
jgi:hypothetical protein